MSEISEQSPAAVRWSPGLAAVALVAALWVAVALFWARAGVFTIDEFVYQAMFDAFARNGSLLVWNGYAEYHNPALAFDFLRPVGDRLAPQYPGGWGILAAPAYLAAGLRGVIFLNALASALTLPLIWITARALFDDRSIAASAALVYALATFAVDYAFGIWPHGFTAFLVAAAFAAVVTGWRGGPAAEMRGALVAGLLLGLGVNIRVDALIPAIPMAVWLLGAGRRPYAASCLLAAGLVPGLAAAAAINYVKFGVPSPASYGVEKGAASLSLYSVLLPLAVPAGLAALALGNDRVRAALYRPAGLAAAALAAIALVLAVPSTQQLLLRIARGFWVLVIDFQALRAPSPGLTVMEDGTTRMFDLVKKSLLQSMPYAAVLLVIVPRLVRGPRRAEVSFCFLVAGVSMIPFALSSWHGGLAYNMRYFLNVVPLIAILAALALRDVASLAAGRLWLAAAAALAVGAAALRHGIASGYPWHYVAQHTLPLSVAAGIAGAAALALVARGALRGLAGDALRGLVALGLALAFFSAWVIDLYGGQWRRGVTAEMAEATRGIADDALLVAFQPSMAGFHLNQPPKLTARAAAGDDPLYPALVSLVETANSEGRPVYAQSRTVAEALIAHGLASGAELLFGDVERRHIYRMSPPPTPPTTGG